jgi:glycosyltransferase involved in cell wall biosynthesis
MPNSTPTPLVSITCLTYNHAAYIRQTLDSFLMQKTDFPFEILINDDCSTDGTVEILREYQAKYPDVIKPVFHDENVFSQGKRGMFARFLFPIARGKYLALCEGDDYWTDPEKLQLQVDQMDLHPDWALCFHQTREVFDGHEMPDVVRPGEVPASGFSVEMLLRTNFIQTNSVMYRKQDYSKLAVNLMPTDLYLHLFHAQFGDIGFIPREMSVYRRHPGGLWWDAGQENQGEIWIKFGVDIVAMWLEVRKLYGGEPTYGAIIGDHIRASLAALIRTDRVNGGGPVRQYVERFPDAAAEFISSQQERLDAAEQSAAQFQDSTNLLAAQLHALRSTRVWRTRNSLLRLARPLGLGKRKVEL